MRQKSNNDINIFSQETVTNSITAKMDLLNTGDSHSAIPIRKCFPIIIACYIHINLL
jgi:hypothetical protein